MPTALPVLVALRYGTVRYCAGYGAVRFGTVRCGSVRCGAVRYLHTMGTKHAAITQNHASAACVVQVTDGAIGEQWTVQRRFRQFEELHRGLLPVLSREPDANAYVLPPKEVRLVCNEFRPLQAIFLLS